MKGMKLKGYPFKTLFSTIWVLRFKIHLEDFFLIEHSWPFQRKK